MLPDVIPGKSSGGKHLKFILEVHPPDIQIVPKDGVHVEGLLYTQGQERHVEWLMWARIGVWIVTSINPVSFCGWAPCHAEDALCENTSCKMPSSRMGNFLVMSSSFRASQSTLAFATRIGWKPSALIFHFWILQVTSREREPIAASARLKMYGSRTTGFLASQVSFRFWMASTTEGPQLAGNQI